MENKLVSMTDLNKLLTERQKRWLGMLKFEKGNIYRHICDIGMLCDRSDGFLIYSDSRNYNDIRIRYDQLNEAQINQIKKWNYEYKIH